MPTNSTEKPSHIESRDLPSPSRSRLLLRLMFMASLTLPACQSVSESPQESFQVPKKEDAVKQQKKKPVVVPDDTPKKPKKSTPKQDTDKTPKRIPAPCRGDCRLA